MTDAADILDRALELHTRLALEQAPGTDIELSMLMAPAFSEALVFAVQARDSQDFVGMNDALDWAMSFRTRVLESLVASGQGPAIKAHHDRAAEMAGALQPRVVLSSGKLSPSELADLGVDVALEPKGDSSTRERQLEAEYLAGLAERRREAPPESLVRATADAACVECDDSHEIPDDDGVTRPCPWCTAPKTEG